MPIVSHLIYQAVPWAARRGLRDDAPVVSCDDKKQQARRTGVRGETFAYWYLRCHGYVFVAKNYTQRSGRDELDLVGYDCETLASVEVRTRTARDEMTALPELSVTPDKQHVVVRTAKRFLAERHVGDCPCRFDVLAIDNEPGHPQVVRPHKDAFSPHM
jgi:putative endonuclease